MAFPLPRGLRVVFESPVSDDRGVDAIEARQREGTRMLVALVFPFRWPGFGASADLADQAVRRIAGLRGWPELPRMVMPDPDGEPVWWVAYLSSPAWWTAIVAAILAFVAAAISFRVVRVIAPEVAAPIETAVSLVPLLLVVLVASLIPNFISLFKELSEGGQ
jgi:uncharacterized membrane protein